MLKHIFTHWFTSAAGLGLAVLGVLENGRSHAQLAQSVAIAIVGFVAKDPNLRAFFTQLLGQKQ